MGTNTKIFHIDVTFPENIKYDLLLGVSTGAFYKVLMTF
jgi:hypothetical protein